MKKWTALTLALLLLTSCAAPAGESSAPVPEPASTPTPAEAALPTPAAETAAVAGQALPEMLSGLTGETIREIGCGWGFFNGTPEAETVAELIREALGAPLDSKEYGDEPWEEGMAWDMTLELADGENLLLRAGLSEDVIRIDGLGQSAYFCSSELYWLMRTEYDSGDREKSIDQEAYETFRMAVEDYLAQPSRDNPEIRMELTGLVSIQESEALGAQVWAVSADMTADPPERALQLVGNGYVDSRLRMHPITSDGPDNLLVTVGEEALGFQNWTWLDAGGLNQYATQEELREAWKE